MGIPLALLVLALAGYWLLRQVQQCNDGARWGLLLAVGAIGAHAITEYPLDYTYFLLTLGLLVGTLQGLEPIGRSWTLPRASFLLPWVGCVAMMFWVGVEYMQVEESARRVRMVLSGVGIDKVPYAPPPNVRLLDGLREYHRFVITPVQRGMSAEQLDWMRDVAQRHPYPPSLQRYALAAGLNGRTEESTRTLRAICNVHPPKWCNSSRESWRTAQREYPELVVIPLP
jgi:Virulence factor membrane-bound polymerase, C-terminal